MRRRQLIIDCDPGQDDAYAPGDGTTGRYRSRPESGRLRRGRVPLNG